MVFPMEDGDRKRIGCISSTVGDKPSSAPQQSTLTGRAKSETLGHQCRCCQGTNMYVSGLAYHLPPHWLYPFAVRNGRTKAVGFNLA